MHGIVGANDAAPREGALSDQASTSSTLISAALLGKWNRCALAGDFPSISNIKPFTLCPSIAPRVMGKGRHVSWKEV
jgi:hypothetical protein